LAAETTTPLLVVGLGNPGSAYRQTRHNVGFMVVDELCVRRKIDMRPGRGDYWWGEICTGDRDIVLIKPVTFMNNSGVAVVDAMDATGCTLDNLFVISDDFALPLGRLRLRKCGSDGGHNGLASIIYQLQSDAFARLRCGIGQTEMPAGQEMATFVLSRFSPEEEEPAKQMITRAADAVEEVCRTGIDTGMNLYNT
jgi:peptidyl-tRNA hydrolase, PTH1 family